jgi:16S rRNA (uracil1498-N3)-methyltransferase
MSGPVPGPAFVAATAHTYVERLDDRLCIDGPDGHHLQRVRRLTPGEVVTAADGFGRWRAYDVTGVSDGALLLDATTEVEHEVPLEPGLVVACALTKGDRPELVVQKLTELGVDRILIVRAARSVVRWDAARTDAALTRLARVAREAGAQSRRARLPVIDGPLLPRELAGQPGLVVAALGGLPVAEVPEPPPADHGRAEWVVAIGPEGGFTPEELDGFGAAPTAAVGVHVLRAETAAISAAAAFTGRRRPPGPRDAPAVTG